MDRDLYSGIHVDPQALRARHHRDEEQVKFELLEFIDKYGGGIVDGVGQMPSEAQLRGTPLLPGCSSGGNDLANRILARLGDFPEVANNLGLLPPEKAPPATLADWEYFQVAISSWIEEHGVDEEMPTDDQLESKGGSDIAYAIKRYHGGMRSMGARLAREGVVGDRAGPHPGQDAERLRKTERISDALSWFLNQLASNEVPEERIACLQRECEERMIAILEKTEAKDGILTGFSIDFDVEKDALSVTGNEVREEEIREFNGQGAAEVQNRKDRGIPYMTRAALQRHYGEQDLVFIHKPVLSTSDQVEQLKREWKHEEEKQGKEDLPLERAYVLIVRTLDEQTGPEYTLQDFHDDYREFSGGNDAGQAKTTTIGLAEALELCFGSHEWWLEVHNVELS